MIEPHKLLLEAALRLFADGHTELAQDVRQLAQRWTPVDEWRLVSGDKSIQPTTQFK